MTQVTNKAHNDILVFDKNQIRKRRERAQGNFHDYDFLFRWASRELGERLKDIKRNFENCLELGSRGYVHPHPQINHLITLDITQKPTTGRIKYIQADSEFMPIAAQKFDLIYSILDLHSVNDLPGTLLQIRQALKPDGLFIAAMLGGETLHELRGALCAAEIETQGGLSPRIAPFADKPQMGDLMMRAGFALPVIDSEIVHVTYDHAFKLMHDLRGMGEGNTLLARDKNFATKSLFFKAAGLYAEKHTSPEQKIDASFEVIFLLGWAPHESQQKPLKRGSSTTNLGDYLNAPVHHIKM